MRRDLALGALSVAIFINALRFVYDETMGHRPIFSSIAFVLLFAILLFARGRWPWFAGMLRIAIGLNFGLAVLDRFGVFGPFGAAGVSWGDWAHFVT
jgi:hypothetical protein